MSLDMSNLLDIEKYFLLELSYYDNPKFPSITIAPEHPISIKDFLESVPECYCASSIAINMKFKNTSLYMQELYKKLKKVYEESNNLKDIEIIGYMNDNYNFLGNTGEGRGKTSLVAFALRDSQGNGMVIYRGCELNYVSNMILDFGGCFTAAFGYITNHHKKALGFYDKYMKGLPGERNIMGHSKGGNLATYVFINRKEDNVNTFVVNAQPYCWFVLNGEQRSWLKSNQYEYIIHSNDPTKAASYVSYISRVIPLNRYKQKDLLSKHLFFSVCFDDYGNLEGSRIFRQTKSRILSKVFNDYISENKKTKEQLKELFSKQMKTISNSTRFLTIAMDEIMLALDAEAGTLWMKSTNSDGKEEYIYPYLIRGPVNDELYKLRLYKGEGLAADSAFNGNKHLIQETSNNNKFFSSVDHFTGFSSKSTVTVPIYCSEDKIIGSLQILNKKEVSGFIEDDLEMATALSKVIGDYLNKGLKKDVSRDFTLLAISDNNKTYFMIERNQYKEVTFGNEGDKTAFYKKITGHGLKEGEILLFNREKFSFEQKDEIEALCRLEFSVMFEKHGNKLNRRSVKRVLLSKIKSAKEKRISKNKILSNPQILNILYKRVCDLTEDEYVEFELTRAFINRPMLIIVNSPYKIFSQEKAKNLLEKIEKFTENKIVTAVVLLD